LAFEVRSTLAGALAALAALLFATDALFLDAVAFAMAGLAAGVSTSGATPADVLRIGASGITILLTVGHTETHAAPGRSFLGFRLLAVVDTRRLTGFLARNRSGFYALRVAFLVQLGSAGPLDRHRFALGRALLFRNELTGGAF
jgi:hypothetical protein